MSTTSSSHLATAAPNQRDASSNISTPQHASTNMSHPTQASRSQSLPEPALPSPQLFDILPALHELLSRLLAASSSLDRPNGQAAPTTNTAATAAAAASISSTLPDTQTTLEQETQSQSQTQTQTQTQTQPQTQSQSQQQEQQTQTQSQSQVQTTPTQQPTYADQTPLLVKDIAAEVSSIRNMIRRAREAVAALPDVDRGVAEQEREIAYLSAQVLRLQGVLGGLKEDEEGTRMQEG